MNITIQLVYFDYQHQSAPLGKGFNIISKVNVISLPKMATNYHYVPSKEQ
jgi:hypothetical protein